MRALLDEGLGLLKVASTARFYEQLFNRLVRSLDRVEGAAKLETKQLDSVAKALRTAFRKEYRTSMDRYVVELLEAIGVFRSACTRLGKAHDALYKAFLKEGMHRS